MSDQLQCIIASSGHDCLPVDAASSVLLLFVSNLEFLSWTHSHGAPLILHILSSLLLATPQLSSKNIYIME
jgi:hypothetical protein